MKVYVRLFAVLLVLLCTSPKRCAFSQALESTSNTKAKNIASLTHGGSLLLDFIPTEHFPQAILWLEDLQLLIVRHNRQGGRPGGSGETVLFDLVDRSTLILWPFTFDYDPPSVWTGLFMLSDRGHPILCSSREANPRTELEAPRLAVNQNVSGAREGPEVNGWRNSRRLSDFPKFYTNTPTAISESDRTLHILCNDGVLRSWDTTHCKLTREVWLYRARMPVVGDDNKVSFKELVPDISSSPFSDKDDGGHTKGFVEPILQLTSKMLLRYRFAVTTVGSGLDYVLYRIVSEVVTIRPFWKHHLQGRTACLLIRPVPPTQQRFPSGLRSCRVGFRP